MDDKYKKPELLVPAGGMDTLKVAVMYGADAVYMGGSSFGLRARADNFTIDEMREAVSFAHANNVKVYVTVNIFAHNDDIQGLRRYFEEIRNIGIDAILVADPGIFSVARECIPEIPIHISTQANNTNYMTYRFWYDMGVRRVVTARELSLREITDIRRNIPDDMEIEAFIHGAMCISYSGRCLLSNYFTGRDANKGACTHPCRWRYAVMEETRPGEYLPVEEDERGTYIFNSKDLSMIEHIPELVEAGISSFKIEGRMKTALYVASTARTYRMAIDDFFKSEELYRSRIDYYKQEIAACTTRDFTTGFYFGKPTYEDQIYDRNTYVQNAIYLGTVEEIDEDGKSVVIYQKNKFSVGDEIEIMMFSGENKAVRVEDIYDEYGNSMESAPHPKQKLIVKLSDVEGVLRGQILRKQLHILDDVL